MNFLDCNKSIVLGETHLASSDLIIIAEETNTYIRRLVQIFGEIGFDIFNSLGQRNISGFIGEIFKSLLAASNPNLCINPHPDGRPDILAIDSPEAVLWYAQCFTEINNRKIPIKDRLTPFRYGGLEVKCSIGSSHKAQTTKFIEEHGHTFSLYDSRVGYLSGINWWAHHSSSSNLLGLYYDYFSAENGTPQVLAAFYSELSSDDWHAVSHGNPDNKKTSNTSLNRKGLDKMKNNCVFTINDEQYISQLKQIGVRL